MMIRTFQLYEMLDANSKTWARHQKTGSFLFLMEIISSLRSVPKEKTLTLPPIQKTPTL